MGTAAGHAGGKNLLGESNRIHIYCRQERRRGERLSRHWHELARLDNCGVADRALADTALALSVARHKTIFFPEKAASGDWIDYQAAFPEACD